MSSQFERLGGEGINANEFGLLAVVTIYFLLLKKVTGKMNNWLFISVGIGLLYLCLATVSRTAYVAMMAVLFLGLVAWRPPRRILYALLAWSLLAVAFYFVNNYIMENSSIGERFRYRATELEILQIGDSMIDKIFGERAVYYRDGWDIFRNNPIAGVGMGNYITNSLSQTHRCHVEYMVQLSEAGLIGTLLFFCFYYLLGKRLYDEFKRHGNLKQVLIYSDGLLVVCLTNFSSYTSNRVIYYAIFGVIVGYLFKQELLSGAGARGSARSLPGHETSPLGHGRARY